MGVGPQHVWCLTAHDGFKKNTHPNNITAFLAGDDEGDARGVLELCLLVPQPVLTWPAHGHHTVSTRSAHGQHTVGARSAHGRRTVSARSVPQPVLTELPPVVAVHQHQRVGHNVGPERGQRVQDEPDARLRTERSGSMFRVGIFLDFGRRSGTTRTPH